MDVLKYTADDYDVIVRTDDISYSWKNFKGRIEYRNELSTQRSNPREYCHYYSSDDCEISIYNPSTGEKVIIPGGTVLSWPVVFETNSYQICIKFKGVDTDYDPQILHIRADVEKAFFLDKDDNSDKMSLVGEVSFLNEPGLFKLDFKYKKNGKEKKASVSFDVVSPKLDIKHDYKRILDDVNKEFEDIIFNYLSTTFQQFGKGREKNLQIWMQVFQQVVGDYLKNIDRIIKNPHSKVRTLKQYAKADRIKRWSPAMEEEFVEIKAADKLDEHYFGYEQYETTVNSLENRFVKYTLKQIGEKLKVIFNKLLSSNNEVSSNFVIEWEKYHFKIEKFQKHPFFKSVGRFEGLNQESLVLQSRMGYQQIYKDWLKLRKGIDFYNGATNVGTLQIWEIYELWCFLKVKNMVRDLLGFYPEKPDSFYGDLIKEPNGKLINYSGDKKTDYRIEFIYPDPDEVELLADEEKKKHLRNRKGDKVTLHYQHTFNRSADDMAVGTATTEQRPDIVLNIINKDGFVLTYLYDAKYRVWSDKNLDEGFEQQDLDEQKKLEDGSVPVGADYPPSDAINQMHRYRDAIYYNLDSAHRPDSKEIIGGYILFPGRGDDKKIKERYFYKSIQKVNIGAFPLLPREGNLRGQKDKEGPQLWEHLEDILLKKDVVYSHVQDSIPQKSLNYTRDKDFTDDYILVGCYKSPAHYNWVNENLLYNIRLKTPNDNRRGSVTLNATYLGIQGFYLYDGFGVNPDMWEEKLSQAYVEDVYKLKENSFPAFCVGKELPHSYPLSTDPDAENWHYILYELDEAYSINPGTKVSVADIIKKFKPNNWSFGEPFVIKERDLRDWLNSF